MKSLIEKSIELYKQGQLKPAEKYALKFLKKEPQNAAGYINLGNIFFLKKEYAKALENYLKADTLRQNYYFSKINLANVNEELGNYDLGIFYAKQALNLKADSKLAYQILGACYMETKKYNDSIASFLHALKLEPQDPWIYNFLSQSYQKKGAFDDALKAGWEAVKLSPEDDSHHVNFGYLLYECSLEKFDKAAREYAAKWLHRFGDNGIAQHMAGAILSNQKILKANEKYLQNVFDIFSADFDNVLKDLDYQVPALLEHALGKIYPNSPKLSILDLGCGTGLCGEFLQNYKKWRGLSGVDISSKMLAKAEAKKYYDNLYQSDLEKFIANKKNDYNLMVAADVFTYIGDLEKLFLSISRALKKNGRILFSISENTLNENGFFLTPSGRFVHNRLYVENLIKKSGLAPEFFAYKKLRTEGDLPVMGYIISCKKI